jgi:flavin-dependent thymidylate synthase
MYEGRVIRNLDDLTEDDRCNYWAQVQKTHLKAPLEFIDLHFMIENVTRAFTHQMVRQRTAVYAQESLRFAVKEQIDARPGPLTAEDKGAMDVWEYQMSQTWEAYKTLINLGIPAEEARGVLPHDTLTRLNFKTNLRNLADHLGNRLCTQAQFEWRMVAASMRDALHNYGDSWQYKLIAASNLFQPVCFTMGRCPFQASFDRGCTIRERVDAGRFSEIRTSEWLADPKAGWQ